LRPFDGAFSENQKEVRPWARRHSWSCTAPARCCPPGPEAGFGTASSRPWGRRSAREGHRDDLCPEL